MTRLSYGAKPTTCAGRGVWVVSGSKRERVETEGIQRLTSRTIDLTKAARWDCFPLRFEGLTVLGMTVVGCPRLRPQGRSVGGRGQSWSLP